MLRYPSKPKIKDFMAFLEQQEPARLEPPALQAGRAILNGKRKRAEKAVAGTSTTAASTAAASSEDPDAIVLLGYYDSRCVGVNHYRNNGMRHDREMLLLLRDSGNRYDRNAITVCNQNWKQVGNVQVGGQSGLGPIPHACV